MFLGCILKLKVYDSDFLGMKFQNFLASQMNLGRSAIKVKKWVVLKADSHLSMVQLGNLKSMCKFCRNVFGNVM